MTVVICRDDRGGRSFGGRRQSRDRRLIERVMSLCGGARLAVSRYSSSLFSAYDNVIITEDFHTLYKEDWCFAEDLIPPFDKADRVIVYDWNRRYPSDVVWDFDPNDYRLTLVSHTEFSGSSHDTITETIYAREERSEEE